MFSELHRQLANLEKLADALFLCGSWASCNYRYRREIFSRAINKWQRSCSQMYGPCYRYQSWQYTWHLQL